MKKICSILLMMVSVVCSGLILSSCSKGYKKMYLTVEYALPTSSGDAEWNEIDVSKGLDYYLSENVRAEDEGSYLLYLRVNVKGTSKKVKSLYVSQSGSTSAMLGDTKSSSTLQVTPNQAFKVTVHNIGSINFKVKPSEGGDDKTISFDVNIWQQLTKVEANEDCIPATVVGSSLEFDKLANLITYYPIDQTNQTGVNYEIESIGTLNPNTKEFTENMDKDLLLEKVSLNERVLTIAEDYSLNNTNNVIKLRATSAYYKDLVEDKKFISVEDADNLITDVYVYIVENFKNTLTDKSLIVSYSSSESGAINSQVGNSIMLYSSSIDSKYKSVNIYAYTAESIYSFIGKPGMELKVYIRDITNSGINSNELYVLYDYKNVVNHNIGLQISESSNTGLDESVNRLGIKLEAIKSGKYQIRLKVDFSAFDFGGSAINPTDSLTQDILVTIENLATGVQINGSAYFEQKTAQSIADLNTKAPAVLYSYYDSEKIGLPLQIRTHVPEAVNQDVRVSFYKTLSNGSPIDLVADAQLLRGQNHLIEKNGNEYVVNNEGKTIWLNFANEPTDIQRLYMVCKVQCTPDSFEGSAVGVQYKTVIIEIPVRASVKSLYIKNENNNQNESWTGGLIEKGKSNIAYIGLGSLNINNVDDSQIKVESINGNIEFSKDGSNWQSSLLLSQLTRNDKNNYTLYYRNTENNVNKIDDSIKVTSENGVTETVNVSFVSVANKDSVTVQWDSVYAWTSNESINERSYIALQYGKSLDFTVLGEGKVENIADIDAVSLIDADHDKIRDKFNSNAISVKKLSSNTFRVETKEGRIGYTSVVELKVKFYTKNSGNIVLDEKVFKYEIAVYVPAQDLNINADKDTIIYINDYYQNVAKMNIGATINNATPSILFSNEEIDTSRIYSIKVEGSLLEYCGADKLFTTDLIVGKDGDYYLSDNFNINIQAIKDLSSLKNTYLYLDFTIYQFGERTSYSVHQNIYVGDHTKSDTIIVESAKVDKYSNIYMNLLKEENKTAQIIAYVNKEATYQELGYELYSIAGDKSLTRYTGSNLIINYNPDNDVFDIIAGDNGGEYVLTIYTKDTYKNDLSSVDVVKTSIKINVSDGSKENPYLINNLADFKLIANNLNKHFRLSGSFDISALESNVNSDNDYWWYTSEDDGSTKNYKPLNLTGSLDGALTIYNPNTGAEVVEQYVLTGLTIKHSVTDSNNYFGLFTSNSGTISNIIFDEVKFDVTISSNLTNPHIGAIVGENAGTIENCSIIIEDSNIKVSNGAYFDNLYIGLMAGANYGNIKFTGNNVGAYMLDCNQGGKLTITVKEQITDLEDANEEKGANIYAGGIAGYNYNDGKISGDYQDNSSIALRSLLTGIVNIELVLENGETDKPIAMGDIALGGAVGINDNAEITNVAITGKLKAYDKISLGGIVGINKQAKVFESANIGMVLECGHKSTYTGADVDEIIYHGTAEGENLLLEQNIGGIIGSDNNGSIDNVRVMFIELDSSDVSVAYGASYIRGLGNIGGIIGKATNTQLTRVFVENFIELTEDTYNIIGEEANIGGFIASNSGNTINVGFVNANINAGNSVVYEFGNGLIYSYVYFVGNIKINIVKPTLNAGENYYKNNVSANSSYINATYIYNDESVDVNTTESTTIDIAKEGDGALNNTKVVGITFKNGKTAKLYWGKDVNINDNLPYLAYILTGETEPTYTLSVQPTDIIVNVDDKYFDDSNNISSEVFKTYNNGIFISYTIPGDGVTTENEICATAIVYYNPGGNNTYKLVSDGGDYGLIEQVILPSIADGKYTIKIIEGSQTITLGDNSITFNKTGRVELEFISIYNKNIRDRVVIFVEEPINTDVVNVNIESSNANVYKQDITVEENTISAIGYSTYKTSNTVINIGLTETKVNFENYCFDEAKAYAKSEIISVKDDKQNEITEDRDSYFTAKYLTTSVNDGYNLGKFEFNSVTLPSGVQYIDVIMKFSVYLNLDKFKITQYITLKELTTGMNTLLGDKYVVVRIHNSATDVQVIPSNVVAQTGEDVDIKVVILTGYVGSATNEQTVSPSALQISKINSKQLIVNIDNQDSINIELDFGADNELKHYITNDNSIWDLFKTPNITYKKIDTGYEFRVNLELKDEYKSILSNCEFKLTISAKSDTNIKEDMYITFAPQQLTNFNIEFYSELAVTTGSLGEVTAEYISGQTESALIIPGQSGLIKIFADKTYAKFDNIRISSNTATIRGEEYYIYFEQMVYDKEKELYKSLRGTTSTDNSLELQKFSYSDLSYEGVIFVRAIIGSVVGVRQDFTITVTAETYNIDGNVKEIKKDKVLLTYYKPGVNITVSNTEQVLNENKTKYLNLVEKNSAISVINANVFGYELNVVPEYHIYKIDSNGDIVKDGGQPLEVAPSQVRLVEQGGITNLENGSTNISYLLVVNNIEEAFGIQFTMKLTEDGQELTSQSQMLLFYPVYYIVKGFNLKGVSNDEFNIGIDTSRDIKFTFTTNSGNKSDVVNDKVQTDLGDNFLNAIYINKYDDKMNIERKNFSSFVGTEESTTVNSFKVISNGDGTYRIKAVSKDQVAVYVDIYYKYTFKEDTNQYIVEFSHERAGEGYRLLHTEFRLNLYVTTSEDAPEPIYDAEGLAEMKDGQNYILMSDITVDNWTPSKAKIASLDGNGYVISIKSFNVTIATTTYVGLFESIAQDSIIKNVVIDVSALNNGDLYINNEQLPNVNAYVGMLASENNGLIYNCEVINLGTSKKNIDIIVGDSYNLIFGGLVANNLGNITNSRVGTEYFEKIRVNSNGSVSKVTLRAKEIAFSSRGIMSGLVGVNGSTTTQSIISNSYVANTSIINSSNLGDETKNRTAGLVATNNNGSTIAYSYVKGTESTIIQTRGRAEGAKLHATGAGNVAGFVFENLGIIHDSYSNIVCYTNSSVVSGFVYSNMGSGNIYQCYSASSVNAEKEHLATKLPFVGIGIGKSNLQELLQYGTLTNCYYLEDETSDYDLGYTLPDVDTQEPTALTLEGFANSTNLNNYAFINTVSREHQMNGVWTYSSSIDSNKSTYGIGVMSLPELLSANQIAHSIRYLKSEQRDENLNYQYSEANGYNRGSSNNPYIVRSVQEYKDVFNGVGLDQPLTSFTGYIRFINNISFKDANGNYESIDTRSNYIVGDSKNNNISIIDGNGMTISGISINYGDESVQSLGLFSVVYNSVIKALNLEFENSIIGSTQAVFAGGVAGYANNTYLIDINLNGANIEVNAKNVAGGLVGSLVGDNSGIASISSNLSAKTGNKTPDLHIAGELLSHTDKNNYSYAGGIAGIIDIGYSKNNSINVSKATVDSINVAGGVAGGVAGYLGGNTYASRLTNYIGANTQVNGTQIAGGLIGENLGNIQLSQVGYKVETQQDLDKNIANYINSQAVDSLNSTLHGNLTAITGGQTIGGFVGHNKGGEITNSYTKASVLVEQSNGKKTVGGFAGQTDGGTFKSVYTQSHINIPANTNADIGGLFGCLNKGLTSPNVEIDNMVASTIFDKAQINSLSKIKDETDYKLDNNTNINYTVGRKLEDVDVTKPGSMGNENCDVYYGVFNENMFKFSETEIGADGVEQIKLLNNIINITGFGNSSKYDMNALYDLSHVDQKNTYETLFMDWDASYWDLDCTKFMPVLREDNTVSLIELETREDVEKIKNRLDGNYILMKDIDVNGIGGSNHVVYGTFTGSITGKRQENGTYPSFTNITLDATTKDCQTAGFFQNTSQAIFNNIGFKYSRLVLGDSEDSTKQFTNIGGVTSEDSDSEFENITVATVGTNPAITTKSEFVVDNFGGIIGLSNRSTIIGGNVSINIGTSTDRINVNTNGNLGGVVGYLNGGTLIDDEEDVNENVFGGLVSDITFSGNILAKTNASNIGGLIGKSSFTGIYNANVAKVEEDKYDSITIDIQIGNSGANYIGGMIGYSENTTLTEINTITNIKFNGGGNNTSVNVGGAIGYTLGSILLENNQYKPVVYNAYTEMQVETPDSDELTMNIGGVVSISSGHTELTTIVTKLVIAKTSGDKYEKGGHVGYLTVGGAIATGNNINISSMMIYLESCYLAYNKQLVAGGVIGHVKNDASQYNITSVGVAGQLFGEDGLTSVTLVDGNIGKLAIMGGMIGAVGDDFTTIRDENKQLPNVSINISDSYTALTLSSANIKGNDDENNDTLYTGAIVGLNKSNTINCSSVVYSSDYVLAFDYDTNATNYTASSLFEAMGSNWTKGEFLPILQELNTILIEHNWVNSTATGYSDKFEGSVFAPININNESTSVSLSGDEYKYYIITTQIGDGNITDSDLNGVLLGCNNNVILSNQFVTSITEHSAISNVKLYIKYGVKDLNTIGLIAKENNGTIFMCSTSYTNINASGTFAGITIDNNGCIAYCYNTGYVIIGDSNVDCAGIAINNRGIISNTYYTGYMNNQYQTYGLVVNNSGYIANSYSAGSANSVIKYNASDKFGRLHNVYFDIYANFNDDEILKSSDEYEIPIRITTSELQDISNLDKIGWTTYTFDSIGDLTDENTTDDMSYNYGYPIHDIKQLKGSDSEAVSIGIQAKSTGNGTISQVESVISNGGNLGLAYYDVGDTVTGKVDESGEEKDVYYIDNSFLISHLGVFNEINTLITESNNKTKDSYFTLEYDIIMHKYDNSKSISEIQTELSKLPSEINSFGGVGGNDGFKGIFVSRTYPSIEDGSKVSEKYIMTTQKITKQTFKQEGEGEDIKYVKDASVEIPINIVTDNANSISNLNIQNLTGPLFSKLANGAVVLNINISNSFATLSSILVNEIKGTTTEPGGDLYIGNVSLNGKNFVSTAGLINTIDSGFNVNLQNIEYAGEFELVSSGNISGVIGTNEGTVVLTKIKTQGKIHSTNKIASGIVDSNEGSISIADSESAFDMQFYGYNNASINGIVNTNSGTITTIEGATAINLQLSPINSDGDNQDDANSIAGLVGAMTSGDVYGFDVEFGIDNSLKCVQFAGIAIRQSAGTISNINVTLPESSDKAHETVIFAGAIGTLYGGTINTVEITLPTADDEGTPTIKAKVFGGVVAISDEVETEEGSTVLAEPSVLHDVTLSGNAIIDGTDSTASGYLIGQYRNKVSIGVTFAEDETKLIVHDGENVGGIIGNATCLDFAFTGDSPTNELIVKGVKNVGGFVGCITSGTITFDGSGQLWPVQSEEAYAKVDIWCPTTANQQVKASNFGGIFGCVTVGDTLKLAMNDEVATVDDGGAELPKTSTLYFINNNSVCTEKLAQTFFKISNATSTQASTCSNIGGVVGCAEGDIWKAINNAQVGVSNYDTYNYKFTEDAVNFIYVGGVVGCVTNQATLTNCASMHKGVFGYGFVGGIVGYVNGDLTISIVDDTNDIAKEEITSIGKSSKLGEIVEVSSVDYSSVTTLASADDAIPSDDTDMPVIGFADVGGVAGRVNGTFTASYIELDTPVFGIANVGGFVGYAQNAQISNANLVNSANNINLAIVGNINVGGIVGYIVGGEDLTKIENVTIKPLQTLDEGEYEEEGATSGLAEHHGNIVVRGVVYDQKFKSKASTGSTKDSAIYYLPTNIGGVVGHSGTSLFSNVKTLARVETEDKHVINEGESKYVTVNMIKNHIANNASSRSGITYPAGFYTNVSNVTPENLEAKIADRNINYDSMNSGIGGFAGASYNTTFSKCLSYGDIYAPYGINVGGAVGFIGSFSANTSLPLMPTTKSTITVAGTDIDYYTYYEVVETESEEGETTEETIGDKIDSTPVYNAFVKAYPTQVAGKIFVGGFVGKVQGGVNNSLFTQVPYVDIQAYIKAEKDAGVYDVGVLAGSCIGGVIGYSTGMVSGIRLEGTDESPFRLEGTDESPLRVFNYTESSAVGSKYVGVIAGRVDGGMDGCYISPDYCGAKWDDDKDLYVANKEDVTITYNDTQVYLGWGVHMVLDGKEEWFNTNTATPAGTYSYAISADGKTFIIKDGELEIIKITKGEKHSNGLEGYSTISKIEYLQNGLIYERVEKRGDGGIFKVTSNGKPITSVQGGIIQDYETYNYGGLVGLASIGYGIGNYTVSGTHYYPFTIDCLQDYYFDLGSTHYDYELRDGKDIITAIPHYINRSNITVSGSSLTDLYDKDGANKASSSVSGIGKTYFEAAGCAEGDADSNEKIDDFVLGLVCNALTSQGQSLEGTTNKDKLSNWVVDKTGDPHHGACRGRYEGLQNYYNKTEITTYGDLINHLEINVAGMDPSNTPQLYGSHVTQARNLLTSCLKNILDEQVVLEGGDIEKETNEVTNHNPLNPEAKGWAKDYTMFKSMAVCKSQDSELTGDYHQIVYDASYITEVYYIYKESSDTDESGSTTFTPEIVYTRYKTNEGVERLYCKFGIATWERDFIEPKLDDSDLDKNYPVSVADLQGTINSSRKKFYQHIEGIKDGVDAKATAQMGFTKGYTYIDIVDGGETKRFNFTSVYGNHKENDNQNYYSASGSVFEITGAPQDYLDKIKYKTFWQKFWDVTKNVLIIGAEIAVFFIPGAAAAKWGIKLVMKAKKIVDTTGKLLKAAKYALKLKKIAKAVTATLAIAAFFASGLTGNSYSHKKFDQINNMSMGLETMSYTRYIDYEKNAQSVSLDKMVNLDTTIRLFDEDGNFEEAETVMPYILYANGNVMPSDSDSWIDVDVDYSALGLGEFKNAQVRKYIEDKGELYIYAQSAITGKKLLAGKQPWGEGELSENNYEFSEADGYYYYWDEYDENCIGNALDAGEKKKFEEEYTVNLTTTKKVRHNIISGIHNSSNADSNGDVDLTKLYWNIVEDKTTQLSWNELLLYGSGNGKNIGKIDILPTQLKSQAGGEDVTLTSTKGIYTATGYFDIGEGYESFANGYETAVDMWDALITKFKGFSATEYTPITVYWSLSEFEFTNKDVIYESKELSDVQSLVYLSPWKDNGTAFSSGLSNEEVAVTGNYYYQCNGEGYGVEHERTYYLCLKYSEMIKDGSVWLQMSESSYTGLLYDENGNIVTESEKEQIPFDTINSKYKDHYINNPIEEGENIYTDVAKYTAGDDKEYNSGQFGYWYEKVDDTWYMRNTIENKSVDISNGIPVLYRNIYGEFDNDGVNYFYYNKYVQSDGTKNLYTNYMFDAFEEITYKTFDENNKESGTATKNISGPLFNPVGKERTILVESARVSLSSSVSGVYYINESTTSNLIGRINCI